MESLFDSDIGLSFRHGYFIVCLTGMLDGLFDTGAGLSVWPICWIECVDRDDGLSV